MLYIYENELKKCRKNCETLNFLKILLLIKTECEFDFRATVFTLGSEMQKGGSFKIVDNKLKRRFVVTWEEGVGVTSKACFPS